MNDKKSMRDFAYPLIVPLVRSLHEQGVKLTEKVYQALNLAACDAKEHRYKKLCDDNLLVGLIRSQGSITHILSQLGIDLEELVDKVHEPVPDIGYLSDYRTRYSEKRTEKAKKRQYKRPLRAFGSFRYDEMLQQATGSPVPLPSYISALSGVVDSEKLFLSIVDAPAVWYHLSSYGLSINKIRRHVKELRELEPDIETQKYLVTFDGVRYRFDAFDLLDVSQIAWRKEETEEGFIICRANIVTPRYLVLEQQIEEFEWLINQSDISEYDIQKFLESHPDFLLGIEYKRLYSQLTLVREGMSDLQPDFFLERIDGPLCDITELKLPKVRLVVGTPNRRTFSHSLVSALGQLKEYRKYFDDPANRREFKKKHGLDVYKPRVYAVMGRSQEFQTQYERRDLEEELSHLRLLTYDDLVARAKQRLALVCH